MLFAVGKALFEHLAVIAERVDFFDFYVIPRVFERAYRLFLVHTDDVGHFVSELFGAVKRYVERRALQ